MDGAMPQPDHTLPDSPQPRPTPSEPDTVHATERPEQRKRDRFPDLLRSVALGAVILGHWTMGAVSIDGAGMMHVDNVLNINRQLWPATWVLVLIPLFFFVGGFSNATSLHRALERGMSAPQWIGQRLKGLFLPVVPFVLLVVALALLALRLGAPQVLTLTIAVVVLMPLWFVAVYAVLAALTPLMLGLHRRFGVRVVVALAILAFIADGLRTALDEPYIGWLNYVFVHGTMQQIGFFYQDGRLQRLGLRQLALWAGGAFALLCVLVATPVWAESMVGLSGERSNMSPPSAPSLVHGLWLIPMAMLAHPWLSSRLDRPRVAHVLDVAATESMRAFLWHLPVMVVVLGVLWLVGVPFATPGTAVWWLLKPLYLTGFAVVLWGWLALTNRHRT
jgi:hypothetical protein